MNYCVLPNIDDYQVLHAHVRNTRLNSFPKLLEAEATLIGAYTEYIARSGNAASIAAAALDEPTKEFLRSDYQRAPQTVRFIALMRSNSAHKVCAMCGSFGSETLDHVLPRVSFPEFAIFSRNLVPACPCNSLRSASTVGAQPGERILHPYFDTCLSERLLVATFDPPYDAPKVDIQIAVANDHPHMPAIRYHLQTIVNRTAVRRHLLDRWATLWRSPRTVLPRLPETAVDVNTMITVVEDELNRLDDLHNSRNNWDSIFVAGLRHPDIALWLRDHVAQPPPAVL